ncbi:MAG: amino acid ABC transporter substrate-binding protein [Alphaproteobacteria bacterium]|nr:MAG: amino acid ABC transporter substrate-binding protein [Alphaproteobacteria bacterium]
MRFLKYFSVFFIICCLTYCSNRTKKIDPIQIVISADYKPFSYRVKAPDEPEGERFTGFEIDLIKEVMKRLNKAYVIEELAFDEIFCAIEGRRADIAISSITQTPDRKERFDFTLPYFHSPQSIVLSVDNEKTTLDDLNPKKVLIQKSSSYPTILRQLLEKYPKALIVEVKDINKILEEFNKNFDKGVVILMDRFAVKSLFDNNTYLKIKTINFQDEDLNFAIMLPKGSNLRTPINKILKELEEDGTIKMLKKKYNLVR